MAGHEPHAAEPVQASTVLHSGDIRRIDRIRDLETADELTRDDRHRTAWTVLESYEAWLSRAEVDDNPGTRALGLLKSLFSRDTRAPTAIPRRWPCSA